jgi:hypothetical protein
MFLRHQLRGGVEVLGERKVIATSGEQFVAQTRCRITDADAANWRSPR